MGSPLKGFQAVSLHPPSAGNMGEQRLRLKTNDVPTVAAESCQRAGRLSAETSPRVARLESYVPALFHRRVCQARASARGGFAQKFKTESGIDRFRTLNLQ